MYILVDDSSQRVNNFGTVSGFGSIWLSEETLLKLENEILKLRINHDTWGEIKWNNVDSNHVEIYKEFINLFNSLPIYFNLITFIPLGSQNIKQYHQGDKKIAEMKAIFALIFYNYQRYKNNFCTDKTLKILFDKEIVNRGDYKKHLLENLQIGRTVVPIQTCNSCHSHLLGGLQLADLLTGSGVAFTSLVISKSDENYSFNLESKKNAFLRHVSKQVDFKPIYDGKPLPTVKSNNWFYRPWLK